MLLIKNFDAGAAIAGNRFVKFGAADYQVIQNAAATTRGIGASNQLGAAASGDPVDVIMAGIADVQAGGSITRGAEVTSNATGQAVAAAAGNLVAGVAMVNAVSGDIIPVLLASAGVK